MSTIALLNGQPHWRELLRQEGVPHVICRDGGIGEEEPAVLVLDGSTDEAGERILKRQLETGGPLLAGPDSVERLLGKSGARRTYLKYIVPDDSALFVGLGVVDAQCWGEVLPKAQFGRTDSGHGAVFSGTVGRSPVVILPFELSTALANQHTANRRFLAGAGRLPSETVAAVARGEVRRLVANCLRELLARQGLPYVRLSPFPPGWRGMYGLRLDTDSADERGLLRTLDVVVRSGVTASWFINTSSLPDRRFLARLAETRQDVQLHCFRHRVFPSHSESLEDIRTGKRLLEEAGFSTIGYAAPFGEWHADLQRAIVDSGTTYSSEFGFCYDDLPVRPVVDCQTSAGLQVPVHPLCLGSFRRSGTPPQTVAEYYDLLALHRWTRREPCILYDHPCQDDSSAELLGQVLTRVRERCEKAMTLTDYARWWLVRESIGYSVRLDPERMRLRRVGSAGRLELIFEREGKEAWLALADTELSAAQLDWQQLQNIGPSPRPDSRVHGRDLVWDLRELQRSWQRRLQKRRRRL